MSTPLERAAEAVLDNFHGPDAKHATWHLNPHTVARAALEAAIDEGELVAFLKKWRFNGFIENAEFASMLKAQLLGGAE